MNVSGQVFRSLDESLIENARNFGLFFAFEWKPGRTTKQQQLTPKSKCQKPDKFNRFFGPMRLLISSNCILSTLLNVFTNLGAGLRGIIIDILLVRGGIEVNPGPESALDRAPPGGFRILSQNCRGLTDRKKLIKLLRKIYPNRKSASGGSIISCLQETHRIDKFAVDNYFNGLAIVDNGERHQRGVCLLIPDLFEVCSSTISGIGRWIIAVVKVKGDKSPQKLVVANIYAPNCHREALDFYQEFFHALDECTEELAVQDESFESAITGDFNVVMDLAGGSSNRASSVAERELVTLLSDAMAQRNLLEPSDLTKPGNHTCRRGTCPSKLDYFFLSRGLQHRVASAVTTWHELGSNLDHAAISVSFNPEVPLAKGRSFPKIFKSDIRNELDQNWLREQLNKAISEIPAHWTPHLKLDYLKMTLRSKTLDLRQMRKREDSSATIRGEIEDIISNPPLSQEASQRLDSLKLKLREIEEAESLTLSLKAGVKWREEGEKSNAYFLARYKARMEGAAMYSINLGNRVVCGTNNIIKIVREFYERLYNHKIPAKLEDRDFCEEFFSNCPRLERDQQLLLARPLDLTELKLALSSCSDSSPGMDGIPYSFYVSYADLILPYVLDSWSFALQSGQIAKSHQQSCISLLPKKGKDLALLGNWRPISLSSCDLKIITKAYANRLKAVLPSILCEAQAAYCPGRDISFNNRILQHAKTYASREGLDFCIVSLDAQKAFDSVSHEYLGKVLEAYDFPNEFLQVFRTLYSGLTAVVQVNGFISPEFKIHRGVKQGDALSCGLFVLGIDPLLRNIIANPNIVGLSVPLNGAEEIEIKALAYADDVTVVCQNGCEPRIFEEYEKLSRVSGLVLNADKTEVFNLIQSQVRSSRINYLDQRFDVGRVEQIRICGIVLARDPIAEYKCNVRDRIEMIESIVRGWGRRSMSLNGRMILAKTFLLSQIVFPAQVVEIGKREAKRVERIIYSFVNGAKNICGPERIARINLKAPKEKGGIGGIDVDSFLKAIAVKQFGKALKLNRTLGAIQRSCDSLIDDISALARSTLRLNYRKFSDQYAIPDLNQIELISGTPVLVYLKPSSKAAKAATEHGIETICNLQQLFHSRRARVSCTTILKSLPSSVSNLVRSNLLVQSPSNVCWFSSTDIDSLSCANSKKVYQTILFCKFPNLKVDIARIYRRLDWPPPGIEFDSTFKNVWAIKSPTLRAIRLKIQYKDVFSNERRHRFGITDSPACGVCGQIESVEHQLFSCTNAIRIWELFARLTGTRIQSLLEVIQCSGIHEHEIVKSTMIKALLQIDRSQGIPNGAVVTDCIYHLGIEAQVDRKRADSFNSFIDRIKASRY